MKLIATYGLHGGDDVRSPDPTLARHASRRWLPPATLRILALMHSSSGKCDPRGWCRRGLPRLGALVFVVLAGTALAADAVSLDRSRR